MSVDVVVAAEFQLIKENFLVSTSFFELFFHHVDSFCCRFDENRLLDDEREKKQQQQPTTAEQHWCQIFIFIENNFFPEWNNFLWKINENQLLMVPKGYKKVGGSGNCEEKLATPCAIEIFLRLVVSVSAVFCVPSTSDDYSLHTLLCCACLCLYLCLTSHKLHFYFHLTHITLCLALFCSVLGTFEWIWNLQSNVSEWKFYVECTKNEKEWMRGERWKDTKFMDWKGSV